MLNNCRDNNSIFLVAFVILLSRIPFIFYGYGSEEDAWGLILAVRNINLSGIYEVSRFPGHPVQEYLLSLIWNWPSWILNLCTAIASTLGVLFFMLALKIVHAGKKSVSELSIFSGVALAFVPVYYINSTNIMDYTWSLSLVLFAFYLMVTQRYFVAGIIIGIACGFRITAGAMIIPFALWHYLNYHSVKAIIISISLTIATALICFIPPFIIYGTGFFTYYEYFPYPPLLKNIYKGTVGAWGVIGFIAVVAGIIISIAKSFSVKKRLSRDAANNYNELIDEKIINKQQITKSACLYLCLMTIALYTISFLKIPQKTAFILPMVPFVILLFSFTLNKIHLKIFTLLMVASSFLLGINLDDPFRGSAATSFSIKKEVGHTNVTIDLFSGPVLADCTKRQVKIDYARSVISSLQSTSHKTVIIAGWWQNELNYYALTHPNPLVAFLYYADAQQLRDSIASGNKIYFLPEQDLYNDLRYKDEFTQSLAQPFK